MARDKKQIYEASDWFKDALQVTVLFIACRLCTNVMSLIRTCNTGNTIFSVEQVQYYSLLVAYVLIVMVL